MTSLARGPVALGLALGLGLTACVRSAVPPPAVPVAGAHEVAPEGEVVPVEATKTPPAEPSASKVREQTVARGHVEVGHRFVDFTAPRLGGGQLRLSEFIGPKVVVLQFWGVRCSPCLAEMAFLSEVQSLRREQLQVIGVNTDRAPLEQLQQAMASRAISPAFPIVADQDFSISGTYTQWLVPVSVLIDRRGVVRAIHTGYNAQLGSTLREEIEGLLTED